MSKTDRSKSAKNAWRTRGQKKIGFAVAEYRRQITIELMPLLREWDLMLKGKKACAVCGDFEPETIFQRHHLNPSQKKNEPKIRLCASCHNILNKIKLTTKREDVEHDLKVRHKRFDQNLKNLS